MEPLLERSPTRGTKPLFVEQPVRERVLDRIRAALSAGDEAAALRIARELQRRWETCAERRGDPG